MDKPFTMISFNCKGVKRSTDCIGKLCANADIIALQETWVMPYDVGCLGQIDDRFAFFGKSAVDISSGVFRGRPHGGVALLWRKSILGSVSVIECKSVRLVAIKVMQQERSFLIFSVYMPVDLQENLIEFTSVLSEVNAIIETNNVDSVFILGDFNAHPGELFNLELLHFCSEQSWTCVDQELLPKDTYTFVSDVYGSLSWLDHCLVTDAAYCTISSVEVLYGSYWSDHMPLQVVCNLQLLKSKTTINVNRINKVIWGKRDNAQINDYNDYCHARLCKIDFPSEFNKCSDKICTNNNHKLILNSIYNNVIKILSDAAEYCYVNKGRARNKKNYITGWNAHVKLAHGEARLAFQEWCRQGKPKMGYLYENMKKKRKIFKKKLKWCQDNQSQIQMDNIAKFHKSKDFAKFWKSTNSLNPKPSLPASVAGESAPVDIANCFKNHFKVHSLLGPSSPVIESGRSCNDNQLSVRISTKEISDIINGMTRGKSPGHDGLSIEHLQYAGLHLPRVLSMFFTLCIGHCHLPDDLIRTVVVPVIKNKTGDASDLTNYRPISLATILAKVLDGVIDRHMSDRIEIHDAQFGFRPNLSTESAILAVKHTVQYYTQRKTPVVACFLDLSQAFDLVSYDLLWTKLKNDTRVASEVVSILQYWYGRQRNRVRWAGVLSDEYDLECGVRQGGLTSPRLFNLYMNGLIEELSRTGIGCHVDGVCVNNVSYADDMVLLSPSIKAMRKLLRICESYAEAHGLKYNVRKSNVLVFQAGNKKYSDLPEVTLDGATLSRVNKFKYLGHWVSEDLSDNLDLERERRALSVRCNMLARRFAKCSRESKITLFKAYCQSYYTCSLWVSYTQRAYNALRVQYNNSFRALMGLSRRCSASGMFAEAHIDGFHAIIRKRCASMLRRLRDSSNCILKMIVDKWNSPLLIHWNRLHCG